MKDGSEKIKVFIVDDDVSLVDMLSIVLTDAGMEVAVAYDSKTGLSNFETIDPDLILLDYMLPGMTGINVLKKIRQISNVPIVMLTAISDSEVVVEALEAGANNYLTKPINSAELIARIHSVINSVSDNQASSGENIKSDTIDDLAKFKVADVVVAPMQRVAYKNDRKIPLTNLEFNFLMLLIKNSERYFSREELLEKVWHQPANSDPRLISVLVGRVREKIEDDAKHPRIVETVRGVGYALGVEVEKA
ncbi:MAG: response regulator transcription factor [Bifidobacteriaceae bacterium]|jgi:two-component system response regulator MtrA|nr:response regulator transcription factor [Bifidobacteriaceae bacterium]